MRERSLMEAPRTSTRERIDHAINARAALDALAGALDARDAAASVVGAARVRAALEQLRAAWRHVNSAEIEPLMRHGERLLDLVPCCLQGSPQVYEALARFGKRSK